MSNLLQVRAQDGAGSATATTITPVVGTALLGTGDGAIGFNVNPAQTLLYSPGLTASAVANNSNQTFASADYEVTAKALRSLGGDQSFSVYARWVSGPEYYMVFVSGTAIKLYRFVSTLFELGTSAAHDWSDGVPHDLTIRVSGSTISVLLDGATIITDTDTALTAAGAARWQGYFVSGSGTSSNGFQFTEAIVADVVGGGGGSDDFRALLPYRLRFAPSLRAA